MRFATVLLFSLLALSGVARAQDKRTELLLKDRQNFAVFEDWYYDDLESGFAEAERTGKPLLVVMRCVPCDACKVFDEQVALEDPRVRPLLQKFIRVRLVKTNGLDLSLFQSDFDQSFAVFMLNADRTIYGRYGTRPESKSQETEMSLDGFAETLAAALRLHAEFPINRQLLARKTPPKPAHKTPEGMPELEKYREFAGAKDFEAKMCIHCHQVREAERLAVWNRGESLTASMLFTWPATRAAGFTLDPKTANVIAEVVEGTPAEKAGFQVGDRLTTLDGQAVISLADAKWALDHAESLERIPVEVNRAGKRVSLDLTLPAEWREQTDISSRATTWDLRRIATGGLLLEALGDDDKAQLSIPADQMALRVQHVGQYGEHAAAKNAGFQVGDVIVEFDGHQEAWRETDALASVLMNHRRGERLQAVVLRDGERHVFQLPVQ